MMLLTGEEIHGLWAEAITDFRRSRLMTDDDYIDEQKYACSVVAKAQLKKVYEWGDEDCFEHPYKSNLWSEQYNRKRHRCPECWQSLLEEVSCGLVSKKLPGYWYSTASNKLE